MQARNVLANRLLADVPWHEYLLAGNIVCLPVQTHKQTAGCLLKKKIQPEEKLLRPYFAASLNAYETRTPATRTTSEVCSLQKGSHNTDTFRSVKNCAALAAAPLT